MIDAIQGSDVPFNVVLFDQSLNPAYDENGTKYMTEQALTAAFVLHETNEAHVYHGFKPGGSELPCMKLALN